MKEIFTENSFYYFYSAVRQVLAGGIALVGAFLIFFIAEVNRKINKTINDAWNIVTSNSDNYFKVTEKLGQEYVNEMDKINFIDKKLYPDLFKKLKDLLEGNPFIENNYNLFLSSYNFKSEIICEGRHTIIYTGIIMTVSLAILPFANVLYINPIEGIFITLIFIFLSCFSIYMIAKVVIKAIKRL